MSDEFQQKHRYSELLFLPFFSKSSDGLQASILDTPSVDTRPIIRVIPSSLSWLSGAITFLSFFFSPQPSHEYSWSGAGSIRPVLKSTLSFPKFSVLSVLRFHVYRIKKAGYALHNRLVQYNIPNSGRRLNSWGSALLKFQPNQRSMLILV